MKQHIRPMYILPPHILSKIAQNGNEEQRQLALQTLGQDQTLRTVRMTHSLLNPRNNTGRAELNSDKALRRTVCDAHCSTELPGEIVRTEGGHPCGDIVANEAFDGLGWAHAFFLQVYGRNSIDDKGMALDATVHYGYRYDNAFWNGERMILGDGDGELFNRFSTAIDIIGHELTHGMIEDEAQLVYMGQSGAINESIADIFGSLLKQYSRNQTAEQADWLIGEGIFTGRVNGRALRSLCEPGSAYNDGLLGQDPQVAHMEKYVYTVEDNGGVHINSGIPNRAFYLCAIRIGGHAWERAGRIWYETLRDPRLRSSTNFRSFARLTMANAERLYGYDSREYLAVREGWQEVGVAVPVVSREAIYEDSAAD